MKKYLSLVTLLVLTLAAFSQVDKKEKEKPPTQKEMQEMMKEMQKELDGMSEEDKKMMDSMGIKMPDAKAMQKNMSLATDAQLAKAYEDDNRIVPEKDNKRIAAIPKKVNDAGMKGYLTAIQKKMVALFTDEEKITGEKIYNYILANSKNKIEAGNMASALWIAGKQQLALMVMGKLCIADPSNTDNLSNYASMLSMLGAQHLAIPVLNNLNMKFPGNSTLLNNLGQAWFGLGEISKAEKYLDSTIRIYAYHPQANLTKAAIEESKGNIPKAIEAVKRSIRHAHSDEKENHLKKLGYKLTFADVRLQFKPSSDPLGLARFRQPDYPKTVSDLKALKPQWEAFDAECDNEIAKLKNQLAEALVKYEQNLKVTLAQSIQAINSGGVIPSSAQKPMYATKASLAMQDLVSEHEVKMKNLTEKLLIMGAELDHLQKTRKKAAPEAPCEVHIKVEDEFLNQYNTQKQSYNNEVLKVFKHFSNDMAYWAQYTSTNEAQFEIHKLETKINWLNKLKEYRPLLTARGYEYMDACVEKKEAKPGKLARFDDVACQYNDTMDLTIITFYNNCSRMTSKFNVKFLEYTRHDDFERTEGDTYTGSTVKFSIEKGFDELKGDAGPLKVEMKVGAGVEFEFDREGVKDVILSVEAKAGAGHNIADEALEEEGSIGGKDVIDTTVEIGVEGRISIISGHGQISGTGMLESLTISEW